jgi:beta-alanine--pyruvate transaminase
VQGSVGAIPPPVGYLKRLRELCDKYGILLIFDEVITGFGRLGAPFASQAFDVVPDMITCAKGLTNGCLPMGAVLVRKEIYEAFMQGPEAAIELFHGYTYSAHPTACAAGLASLAIYERERLFERVNGITAYWEEQAHATFRGLPHVVDVRNCGLIAGVEFAPVAGKPGARGLEVFLKCFDKGVLVRASGDVIALSPPLILEKAHVDEMFGTLAEAIREIG